MNATRQKLFDTMKKAQEAEKALLTCFAVYKDELKKPLYKVLQRRNQEVLARLSNDIFDEMKIALQNAGRAAQGLEQICEHLEIKGDYID